VLIRAFDAALAERTADKRRIGLQGPDLHCAFIRRIVKHSIPSPPF
jgi:hypothetical protein